MGKYVDRNFITKNFLTNIIKKKGNMRVIADAFIVNVILIYKMKRKDGLSIL